MRLSKDVFLGIALPGLLLLSGCTMAPHYERPDAPIPSVWSDAGAGVSSVSDLSWQQFFNDPALERLISLALEQNRDLQVANLNVEQLAARYQIEKSALLPALDATGSWSRERVPADLSPTGQANTSSVFTVGGAITSYELDFFGRVRSLKDRALEQYLASEEARLSYEINTISSVAKQYFAVLALQQQLNLSTEAEQLARQYYDLNQQTFDAGAGSELDLRASEARLRSLESNVAALKRQVAQAQNALVFLVGAPLPTDLLLTRDLGSFSLMENLPAGLPSDLLTRRPDILAAEHNLRAANAYIGAARAAFFPSIRLTAFGGTASQELEGLFEDGSGMWSFQPSIAVPIFNSGRNRANLDIAKISKKIEIANYEKSIQNAFREVSDTLSAREYITEQLKAQQAGVEAADRSYVLSTQLYKAGSESYFTVIVAEQERISAELSLVQIRLLRLTNLTSLFAALGGGWESS